MSGFENWATNQASMHDTRTSFRKSVSIECRLRVCHGSGRFGGQASHALLGLRDELLALRDQCAAPLDQLEGARQVEIAALLELRDDLLQLGVGRLEADGTP